LRIWSHATAHERALVFDPELGWRMLPNAQKLGGYWGGKWPAHTNSHGFRDRERTFDKKPGVARLVSIGDSFTFGADVDDGERFTDILETLSPTTEVLNLGVQAYGPDQELVLLEREGFRYAPDVVLWVVFLGNDLYDIRFARRFHWPRPYFTSEAGVLTLHRAEPSWDVRLRLSSYLGEVAFRTFSGWIPAEAVAPELAGSNPVEQFTLIARRIAADCASHRARLLAVVLWPTKEGDFDRDGDFPRAVEALKTNHIEVFDTQALLSEDQPDGAALWFPHGHWTALGHRRLAEALFEKLSKLGWI